jgi:hypothetical protein
MSIFFFVIFISFKVDTFFFHEDYILHKQNIANLHFRFLKKKPCPRKYKYVQGRVQDFVQGGWDVAYKNFRKQRFRSYLGRF